MALSFDEILRLVASKPTPLLVAIDGLPLAGKSTLAFRLIEELSAECLWLDDFVKPQAEWTWKDRPSFPFDYIRYGEFIAAVTALARHRRCVFHPYDWDHGRVAELPRAVRGDRIAIVEGVSALHPDLAPLYDLRIWVESDPATTLKASVERGTGSWQREWELVFLPSVDLYLETNPRTRADLFASGRGAAN
jgi:uridine kinase